MTAMRQLRSAAEATPSRSMSAMTCELENLNASVAIVAAAGRETRAPQASVTADVRRLKSSCPQPSTSCRVKAERRPVNSQPAANQRGGLGNAHQLFGADLPKILEELNEVLAA
jgi:hypothetical protein